MPAATKQQNLKYNTSQLFNFSRDSYLERTSRPFYAIMFLLPFIIFYEVGTLLINNDVLNQYQVRVVAFVWLQEWLGHLGYDGKLAWMAPPLVVILILLGLQLASGRQWFFNFSDVGPMAIECTLLAIPLIVLSLFLNSPGAYFPEAGKTGEDRAVSQLDVQSVPAHDMTGNTDLVTLQTTDNRAHNSLLAHVVTGIGAGIYEELVFRLLLICVLMMFFQDLLGINHTSSVILSILISAALFSAHHHFVFINGQLTKSTEFCWTAFGFRTMAGVYFAVLFAVRGFGMAAGTHAFYDIIATMLNAIFFYPDNL
jgi:hypothetical protein